MPGLENRVKEEKVRDLKSDLVYRYRGGLYINLTNRCPTACVFCVKSAWKMCYRGYHLRLEREPSAPEILERIKNAQGFREVVFCGYGEPTQRLEELLEISQALKEKWWAEKRPGIPRIRLNTIGLGNLIHGRDIVPDLIGRIEAVSVSLNTADPGEWVRLHRPRPQYREGGFESVLAFIWRCVMLLPETTVTAVRLPGMDLTRCRALADSLGARFRIRPYLGEGI